MRASKSLFYPFIDSTSTCALVARIICIYVTLQAADSVENPAIQHTICQLNIALLSRKHKTRPVARTRLHCNWNCIHCTNCQYKLKSTRSNQIAVLNIQRATQFDFLPYSSVFFFLPSRSQPRSGEVASRAKYLMKSLASRSPWYCWGCRLPFFGAKKIVGKPWTSYGAGMSLAVASILAITMSDSSFSFCANSSYLGASALQWPHLKTS